VPSAHDDRVVCCGHESAFREFGEPRHPAIRYCAGTLAARLANV
jgi:hypothetical protein